MTPLSAASRSIFYTLHLKYRVRALCNMLHRTLGLRKDNERSFVLIFMHTRFQKLVTSLTFLVSFFFL